MSAVTIRNLPQETHDALKRRALLNKRSTEAEIRAILEAATVPQRVGVGTALYEFGRKFGGIELDTNLPGDKPDAADYS